MNSEKRESWWKKKHVSVKAGSKFSSANKKYTNFQISSENLRISKSLNKNLHMVGQKKRGFFIFWDLEIDWLL